MKPTAVTSRCVAVVMSRSDGDRPGVSTGCTPENGYDIFRQFLSENQRIVWNPHVTYSIQSVDFVGFVRPGTLFLSGAEQHLECLRNAWARRLLKPPVGFTIKSVGDVGGIEMQEIPQTQFLSLPDVLCTIVSDLNRFGHPVTTAAIVECLQQQYFGMNIPKEGVICTALGNLVAQGKLFCMGNHYFVPTPNMFPQTQHYRYMWGPEQPRKPCGQMKTALSYETCSKECQTGDSIIGGSTFRPIKMDKAAVARTDLINQKETTGPSGSSNAGTGKRNIGEKLGFIARIFGRSKVKSQKNKIESDIKEKPGGQTGVPPATLTFCTQFPPPEWLPDSRYVKSVREWQHQPIFGRIRRHRNGDTKDEPVDSAETGGKQKHSVWIDLDPVAVKRNRSDRRYMSHRFSGNGSSNGRKETEGRFGRRSPSGDSCRQKKHHRIQKYLSSSSECLVSAIDRKLRPSDGDWRCNAENQTVKASLTKPTKNIIRSSPDTTNAWNNADTPRKDAIPEVNRNNERRKSDTYSSPWKPTAIKVCTREKGDNHDSALSSSPVISDMYSSDSKSGGYSPSGEQLDSGRSSKGETKPHNNNAANGPDPEQHNNNKDPLDHTYVNGISDHVSSMDHTYENVRETGNEYELADTTKFETIDDTLLDAEVSISRQQSSQDIDERNQNLASSIMALQIRVSPTYISAL